MRDLAGMSSLRNIQGLNLSLCDATGGLLKGSSDPLPAASLTLSPSLTFIAKGAAQATAATAYGNCGIKVWIFRGELMEHDPMAMENARNSQQGAPR